MSRIRDIRKNARRVLNDTFKEPAYLFVSGVAEPIGCYVRAHDQNRMIGDLKGTSFDFAEIIENTPVAVFWLEDFDPTANASMAAAGFTDAKEAIRRGTIIRLQDLEGYGALAYAIDSSDPVHGATVNAAVTLLDRDDAATYTAPPDTPFTAP